ncbi:MAG: hypothetical protein K8T25_08270 [Planctomycetia bacterium]|nr:hypothetical protein [Planctomycetia bacterium]
MCKKCLMPAVEAGKITAIREMRQLVLAKLKIAEFCDRRKRLDAKEEAAADQAARSARPWDYMHELVPPPSGIVHPPTSRMAGATPQRQRKPRRARPRVPGATPQPSDPGSASAMPEAPGPANMFPPPSPAYLESTGISQEIYIRALHLLRDKLRERAASEDAAVESATITTPATGEHTDTSPSSSDPEPRPP